MIKQEIRNSIIQQAVTPTFDRSAWKGTAKSDEACSATEQPCSKLNNSDAVRTARTVLKPGGFNRLAWQPAEEQSPVSDQLATIQEKPIGFDKSAWKPKHG